MSFYLFLCFYGSSQMSFSPFNEKASNFPILLGSSGRTAQENPIYGGQPPHWFNSLEISTEFHVCTKFYIRNDSYHAETELRLHKNKFGKKINEGSCSQKDFCTILSSLLAAWEKDIQYLKILSRFWADWFWNLPPILPFNQHVSSRYCVLTYCFTNLITPVHISLFFVY